MPALRDPRLVFALCVMLGLVSTGEASAQGKGAVSQRISVVVMVVHASKQPGQTDPGCQQLKKRLKVMNFESMRVVKREQFQLGFGDLGQMALPGEREVRFMPISMVNRELHMQVELPGMVNTRMSMRSGRGVILGGFPHEGGHLVVHLRPSFLPRRKRDVPMQAGKPNPAVHRAVAPALQPSSPLLKRTVDRAPGDPNRHR